MRVFPSEIVRDRGRGIESLKELNIGVWHSLVVRLVRDQEVVGSNPVTPTKSKRGEQKLPSLAFVWGDGEEKLLRACCRKSDLRQAKCMLDTIGSDARGAARVFEWFESRHSDHMKIIRTFSYLEKRSDYLFF